MIRFELVRVVITKDDTGEFNVGETYCAIKDRAEFAPNTIQFQPYGIITHPIDAKTLMDMVEEANMTNNPINLCDDAYFNWAIYDDVDCEEIDNVD